MNDHADECACSACTEPCTAPTPDKVVIIEADQEGRGLVPAPHIPDLGGNGRHLGLSWAELLPYVPRPTIRPTPIDGRSWWC
jgi:hypothetical protein